jgi:hypothetical protein
MAIIKQLETFSSKGLQIRRYDFDNFQRDRFSFLSYILCLVSVLGQVSLILVSWGKFPPQIPLFYSRPWGEEILAAPIFIWILPGIALISLGINHALSRMAKSELFLIKVLTSFSLLVSITTLYGTVKIISLLT